MEVNIIGLKCDKPGCGHRELIIVSGKYSKEDMKRLSDFFNTKSRLWHLTKEK